jgi:outer membrane protein
MPFLLRRKFAVSFMTWLVAISCHSLAESPNAAHRSEPPLTLPKALRLANERNLRLRRQREEAVVSQGRITEVRSAALPHVDMHAQYARLDDVMSIDLGTSAMTMGQKDNYEVAAEIRQLLYAGGSVSAALRLAREHDASVVSQTEYAEDELAFAVHAVFNRVLLSKEHLAVAKQAMRLAEKNCKDVSARLNQGLARRFDLLRANEQLSRSESDHLGAENAYLKARLDLLNLLDLPLDDPRDVAGSLRYKFAVPPGAGGAEQATNNRSDVASMRSIVAVHREALRIAKSGNRPTLAIFGQLKYANPDRSFADEWEDSWMVGIRAEMPIFDGLETHGKVAQARAQLRQAELMLSDLLSKVHLETAQAKADLATATHLVGAREKNREQAKEALHLAQRAYKEGLQEQIDVITALLAFTESQRNHAAALFQHTMAVRQLQRATGVLVPRSDPRPSSDTRQQSGLRRGE